MQRIDANGVVTQQKKNSMKLCPFEATVILQIVAQLRHGGGWVVFQRGVCLDSCLIPHT